MSRKQIIRAWKDEAYRESLTEDQKARLPEHPAGLVELTTDRLDSIEGGYYHTFLGVHYGLPNIPCDDTTRPR
jgi:mersacidin/lichenicidin family type 2 lantibiotic